MKLEVERLTLQFANSREVIKLAEISCFHGKISTGKSSIARLVDYCLGGKLIYTPALQEQFIEAAMELNLGVQRLTLARNARSTQVRVKWAENGAANERIVNLKDGFQETLSDLMFRFSGCKAPRLKGGVTLTMRDLLQFCYLDQDSMDSEFFGLEREGTSRDVMRLLVGWHNEDLLDIENELETVQTKFQRDKIAAQGLRDALRDENLPSPQQIEEKRRQIAASIENIDRDLSDARESITDLKPHAVNELQQRARALAERIDAFGVGMDQLRQSISKDESHLNTFEGLMDRAKRAEIAQRVLKGVVFEECPACFKALPERADLNCPVCGQSGDGDGRAAALRMDGVDADIQNRIEELKERLEIQKRELHNGGNEKSRLEAEKLRIDSDLDKALEEYDSAYLSRAIELEKEKARLVQQATGLDQLEKLARRAEQMENEVAELSGKEKGLKHRLKEARKRVEEDHSNLDRLKSLFLDCLSRARLPGLGSANKVELPNSFIPEVYADSESSVRATFENMGGGKKVFFKCCFALAVHRLSARTKGLLPSLLILDSPMKSISERENIEQFAGFHRLLYELIETELKGTQVILIDKEIHPPQDTHKMDFLERYMTPDDSAHPPLVPGYHGQ